MVIYMVNKKNKCLEPTLEIKVKRNPLFSLVFVWTKMNSKRKFIFFSLLEQKPCYLIIIDKLNIIV